MQIILEICKNRLQLATKFTRDLLHKILTGSQNLKLRDYLALATTLAWLLLTFSTTKNKH